MQEIQSRLLEAVQAAFRQETVSFTLSKEQLDALLILAQQQKLLPLIFDAMKNSPALLSQPETAARWRTLVRQQVMSQTVRSEQFGKTYAALEAAGFHPLVVKGRLCSALYPQPDLRLSGDDDVLVPDAEFLPCCEALCALGYQASSELSAQKPEIGFRMGGHFLELHRRLVSEPWPEANELLQQSEPVILTGVRTLAPTEHLLYLLLHAARHFLAGGFGLRQIADIGLWAGAYEAQIDWPRLRSQLQVLGTEGFARGVFGAAKHYLHLPVPEGWAVSGEDALSLVQDCLEGGIYGTATQARQHSAAMTLSAAQAGPSGDKSGLLRTVFPPRSYMEQRSPWLKGRPWLLPAAWIGRLADYARNDGANSGAKQALALAKERRKLLQQYGLLDAQKRK